MNPCVHARHALLGLDEVDTSLDEGFPLRLVMDDGFPSPYVLRLTIRYSCNSGVVALREVN